MSTLSKAPEAKKFERSNEERRGADLGPPNGEERRNGHADRRAENNHEFVTFFIGKHLLGIPVEVVQEVIPHQGVTSIPRATKDIRGLMNLRGQIVTVVNLRAKLGLHVLEAKTCMNVIVNFNEELLSLEADSVGDVLPFAKHLVLPAPPTLDGLWRETCEGVVQMEKGLLIIINVAKIFGFADAHKRKSN